MLRVIEKAARYVSVEIESDNAYQEEKPYQIYLNGKFVREDRRHIQSFFSLDADTAYTLLFIAGDGKEEEVSFHTEKEDFRFSVKEFGAVGDGHADDTQAIQTAIYACPKGSTVLIPEGEYRFTSLFIKSHSRIELAKNAVLKAIESRENRAILPGVTRDYKGNSYYLGSWEGNPLDSFAGLITLIDVEDVRIYGEGTLDANASKEGFWHEAKKRNVAWRPRSVFMKNAKDISLVGITIKNSPSWTVHPLESEHLRFINTFIQNPWDSPNTDGINPESCKHVAILGCHFSLGDDCIAIKSGKVFMARAKGIPSQDIQVRNCFMEHGHGAVTIGSEMASGVKDVRVEQCVFQDTDRGLRIKTRRGRGALAVVDKIHFENVKMHNVMAPFVLNMFYFCDPDGHSEYVQSKEDIGAKPEDLPSLRRFVFKDISVTNTSASAFFAYGLPEEKIESILLENISIEMLPLDERVDTAPAMMDGGEWTKEKIFFAKNVKDLRIKNLQIEKDLSDTSFIDAVEHYEIEE